MRAIFILFFILIMGINSASAYELVFPKEKKSIVNTNYIFFVGKANKAEDIVINDEKVYVAPNGAFAHSVKLKEGENRIIVRSNFNTQIYKYYKAYGVLLSIDIITRREDIFCKVPPRHQPPDRQWHSSR